MRSLEVWVWFLIGVCVIAACLAWVVAWYLLSPGFRPGDLSEGLYWGM